MQVFLDHIYRYKLLVSHVLSQQQGFPFLLAKKMQQEPEPPLKRRLRLSAPANKKISSGSTLKVATPAPQHWV